MDIKHDNIQKQACVCFHSISTTLLRSISVIKPRFGKMTRVKPFAQANE